MSISEEIEAAQKVLSEREASLRDARGVLVKLKDRVIQGESLGNPVNDILFVTGSGEDSSLGGKLKEFFGDYQNVGGGTWFLTYASRYTIHEIHVDSGDDRRHVFAPVETGRSTSGDVTLNVGILEGILGTDFTTRHGFPPCVGGVSFPCSKHIRFQNYSFRGDADLSGKKEIVSGSAFVPFEYLEGFRNKSLEPLGEGETRYSMSVAFGMKDVEQAFNQVHFYSRGEKLKLSFGEILAELHPSMDK